MQKELNHLHKLRIIYAIAFVAFCFAIGEVTAILLTGLVYDISSFQIFEMLKAPSQVNKSLVLLLSFFSTLFRFMVVPGLYLLLTNRSSISFLWPDDKIHFKQALLAVLIIISLLPCTSILIDFNNGLELPVWLSEVETYFKNSEVRARQLTSRLLTFEEPKDLAMAILIMAIIPGIAEELFFRGVVQLQFQNILKNPHYTILLSAAVFSFAHFQFYGFIPRMALGMLLGYVFYWSKNIGYPIMMHITNNLISVLGAYFFGPKIMNPDSGSSTTMLFIIPSIVLSILIIFNLKRNLMPASGDK
jgi:uncharacterized protein